MGAEGNARIELMDIDEIKGYPRNPKDHDVGAISQSVDRFGFKMPPAIDEKSGFLFAGHGRLDTLLQKRRAKEAAPEGVVEREGKWLIPVIRGLSFKNKKELEAYIVADNRTSEIGGWLEDVLATVLTEQGDSLPGTGYDDEDLAALRKVLEGTPPGEFPSYDESIHTEAKCPRCGYEFSGGVTRKKGGKDVSPKGSDRKRDKVPPRGRKQDSSRGKGTGKQKRESSDRSSGRGSDRRRKK